MIKRTVVASTCTECGHVCDDAGEFHPYLFCLLKRAGCPDPWREFRWAVERLGVALPSRPPLVRNLPLFPPSPASGGVPLERDK